MIVPVSAFLKDEGVKSFRQGRNPMSIEDIIRAWKANKGDDEDEEEGQGEPKAPANPAGEELSDEELEGTVGGANNPTFSVCVGDCTVGGVPGGGSNNIFRCSAACSALLCVSPQAPC
jgi:mersacidin/lichenicidin family type 2 lantibiotic